MAISWGAWEYSGGNGMRVGIEVDWSSPGNGSSTATATVKYYTDNQYSYSDGQTLNLSGAIDATIGFTNGAGASAVLRATRTYTYTYGASSYGSSPGTRTFTASVSGAYNGVTPSKSVTSDIPARPYGAPAAPSSVAVSRVSDTSTKVSWVNNADAGNPYTTLTVQRSLNGAGWVTVSSPSGATTSVNIGSAANEYYRFQVRANNSIGSSSFVVTGYIYTSPLIPTAPSISAVAGGQRVTWANTGMGYSDYVTEIIGYKNGVSIGVIGTVAAGVATWDHTTSTPTNPYTTGDRWKYTVRHRTSVGTALYSAETAFTAETAGVTSPPSVPTGLDPSGGIIDPTVVNAFAWTYNPTDQSAQTAFQIRRRLQGAGTWTTETAVTSSAKTWNLPANTYSNGNVIEWQVRTRGAATTGGTSSDGYSDWSASAFVTAYLTKLVVPRWNVGIGELETDLSGYDWIEVGSAGAPAFGANWSVYSTSWTTPGFCRRGGIVYLKGLWKYNAAIAAGGASTNMFTLPAGFRPSFGSTGVAASSGLHVGIVGQVNDSLRINIMGNGDVKINNSKTATAAGWWFSLDGVCFPADL